MVRQYIQVTDNQRRELVRLIHQESCSIAKASKLTGIPYDNAKAINRTYLRERRIHKINYRLRYQKKTLGPIALIDQQQSEIQTPCKLAGEVRPELTQPNNQISPSIITKNLEYQIQTPPKEFQINQENQIFKQNILATQIQRYGIFNSQQSQVLIPQVLRPTPQIKLRGGLQSLSSQSIGHNPNVGFFDFSNYSSKIIQRVSQKQNSQHPSQNIPQLQNKESHSCRVASPRHSTNMKVIQTAGKTERNEEHNWQGNVNRHLINYGRSIPNLMRFINQ